MALISPLVATPPRSDAAEHMRPEVVAGADLIQRVAVASPDRLHEAVGVPFGFPAAGSVNGSHLGGNLGRQISRAPLPILMNVVQLVGGDALGMSSCNRSSPSLT